MSLKIQDLFTEAWWKHMQHKKENQNGIVGFEEKEICFPPHKNKAEQRNENMKGGASNETGKNA